MKKKNPRIGSSFESWLDEIGIREEVTVAAKKDVAEQLADKAKREKVIAERRDPRDVIPRPMPSRKTR